MRSKENLFSKGNQDTFFEEIIEKKYFSDEVKSLILNILYKINISYKDYSKIKYDVKQKNEIISEISNIINEDCNIIELDSKSKKNEYTIDKKEKKITVFPNEIPLIEALYCIDNGSTEKIKSFLNKAFLSTLNRGRVLDAAEIIRDFNGWSWTSSIENNNDRILNIIYQNLIILIGRKHLEEIKKSKSFRDDLINKLQEIYGEKKSETLMNKLDKCCILAYVNSNKDGFNELQKYIKKQEKILVLLEDKPKYIYRIKQKNNDIMNEVTKISNILSSDKKLEKVYMRPGIKEKYKYMDSYREYLVKIQNLKLKQIEKNSDLINPFEYEKRKIQLQYELNLLKSIAEININNEVIYKNIIDLQRLVISCFYKKIEIFELRKELLNLVHELRYYNYTPIDENLCIKDIKELEVDIRNVQFKIISKLSDAKVIESFSTDYNINYLILKYMFITKTINLNKLYVKISYDNKKLRLQYYDENEFESEITINLSKDDFEQISKKTGKKIKLFI